jgi:hypothetical protein
MTFFLMRSSEFIGVFVYEAHKGCDFNDARFSKKNTT